MTGDVTADEQGEADPMIRLLATLAALLALVVLTLYVVTVARTLHDQHRERRRTPLRHPASVEGPAAWRQWAAYYGGLADHARAEGSPDSAAVYDSLASTYRTLASPP